MSEEIIFSFANGSCCNRSHVDHEICVVPLEVLVSEDDWFVGSNSTVQLTESPSIDWNKIEETESLVREVAGKTAQVQLSRNEVHIRFLVKEQNLEALKNFGMTLLVNSLML